MSRSILFITLLVILAACSRGERRDEVLLGADAITLQESDLTVIITHIRQHQRRLDLALDLHNEGNEALELRSLSEPLEIFQLRSHGRLIHGQAGAGTVLGPWTGYHDGQVSERGGHLVLAPGARMGLRLHFPMQRPFPDRHRYPWTLLIGPIYAVGSDSPLPTIRYHDGG